MKHENKNPAKTSRRGMLKVGAALAASAAARLCCRALRRRKAPIPISPVCRARAAS